MLSSTSSAANASTLLEHLSRTVTTCLGKKAESLEIARAVVGSSFTGVQLTNGVAGLCATPSTSPVSGECCGMQGVAAILPSPARQGSALSVLQDIRHSEPLRRAVAIAVLNALAEMLWQKAPPLAGTRIDSGDVLSALAITPGDNLVMVGAFPSYLRKLRQRSGSFSVLELNPAALAAEDMAFFVPAEQAERVIPSADVLIITGSSLANGTIDELLRIARRDARVAIVGPSVPLCAAPYLQRGVAVIGGSRVVAGDELLDRLAEGVGGHHLFSGLLQRVTLRRIDG